MLTTRKRKTSGPFVSYEVYYNDSFLDYIWQPKKFKGPNGEMFLVPPEAITGFPNPPTCEREVSEDMKKWNWFFTLEEAKEYLLTSKFAGKL